MYMGHVQRVVNQDRGIAAVIDSTRNEEIGSSVLFIIDNNMKFETIRVRETSTELFRKWGMECHGSVFVLS